MKVLVVSTSKRCPAVSALDSEQIPHSLILATGSDYQYGRTLRDAWAEKEAFINIEQDIVPWPGALQQLWACHHLWCTFRYPIGHSGKLQTALGLVKFSKLLIDSYPDAWLGWDATHWSQLDAQVYGALQIDREIHPHIHTPPVAHLTDMKTILPAEDPRLVRWANDHYEVLGMCIHGIDLDRQFCEQGCRV